MMTMEPCEVLVKHLISYYYYHWKYSMQKKVCIGDDFEENSWAESTAQIWEWVKSLFRCNDVNDEENRYNYHASITKAPQCQDYTK